MIYAAALHDLGDEYSLVGYVCTSEIVVMFMYVQC